MFVRILGLIPFVACFPYGAVEIDNTTIGKQLRSQPGSVNTDSPMDGIVWGDVAETYAKKELNSTPDSKARHKAV